MKTILIFSEGVTLAHFLRPLTVAKYLTTRGYKVFFAATEIPDSLRHLATNISLIPLQKYVSTETFLKAIAKGAHPFTEEILIKQIEEDMALIKTINPDLIMGDMRLSLHVSAQLTNKVFVGLSNSQWDKHAQRFNVVPELPIVKIFGYKFVSMVMSVIQPMIMWDLARPFNNVAKKYNVKPYGTYFDVISSGDYTLYFDSKGLYLNSPDSNPIPDFTRSRKLEIGALDYSIKSVNPPNRQIGQHSGDQTKRRRKKVLISLGSSGPAYLLQKVVNAVKNLDVDVIVATSGAPCNTDGAKNVKISDYVCYDEVVPETDLVISNGGSATTYPVLQQGVPVLAIPMNFDQHLFVTGIEKWGASQSIRSDELTETEVVNKVIHILNSRFIKDQAVKLAAKLETENPLQTILKLVQMVTKTTKDEAVKPTTIQSLDHDLQKRFYQ